jgi:hypothetical protein
MQAMVSSAARRDERELRDARFAMHLSLIVGLAMLIGKTTVYFMTHSAAIFSDAAESVVHVIAVGFASLVFGSVQNPLPLNSSTVTSGSHSSPLDLKQQWSWWPRSLVLTPKQTQDGSVFEVTGDVSLFQGNGDVMLTNSLEGIAEHYIGGTISLTGVVLNPSLPLAAWKYEVPFPATTYRFSTPPNPTIRGWLR